MKLRRIEIQNFRGFAKPVSVEIDDFTALIGRNDIGKSTVLAALTIFLEGDGVKIEPEDGCLQEIQTDEYWQDVTTPILEIARKRLRALIKLIEKVKRKPVYSDFEDSIGDEAVVALPGIGTGTDFERFQAKARRYLREHEDHLALQKVRLNRPLTKADLAELERMLRDAGGTADHIDRARSECEGLGLFIRSLVGLDREAAKAAFDQFLSDRTATATQIHFINLLIDHLTQRGVMDPGLLYESPFTDLSAQGPEGVFSSKQVDRIIAVLRDVRQRAAG